MIKAGVLSLFSPVRVSDNALTWRVYIDIGIKKKGDSNEERLSLEICMTII